MTDNEIIKALMCCSGQTVKCKSCPACLTAGGANCKKVIGGALDIINRQKVEIETLQYDMELLKQEKIFIENQAIKEFTERLKKEYHGFDERYEQIFYSNLITAIDDLVKEMTEEKEQ